MKFFDATTKRFLKRNKEGVLIGGVMGAIAAYYLKAQGVNFLFAADSTGLINYVMTGASKIDLAFTKLFITYIIIGAAAGFVIDALINPKK